MKGRRGIEVEVKLRVDSLDEVRQKLLDRGARYLGAGHEVNLCFDDAAGTLRMAGRLLRLRRDARATLTLKSPAPAGVKSSGRLKVRREVEVEVSSFEDARELLEALGFRVSASYEKEREAWHLDGATVLLDELSIGRFVEIEGEAQDIDRVSTSLGLDTTRGITQSYLDLLGDAR